MKERPILFSAPMVRAILDGRKTQTRCVVKPYPGRQAKWLTPRLLSSAPAARMARSHEGDGYGELGAQFDHPRGGSLGWVQCPFGQPGDRLWVRETWAMNKVVPIKDRPPGDVIYRAELGSNSVSRYDASWSPSIHMPRWASRITLEITAVRIERLQDISEEDARAEGASLRVNGVRTCVGWGVMTTKSHRTGFVSLWDSINARRHPWSSTPWVWVIEFRRVA